MTVRDALAQMVGLEAHQLFFSIEDTALDVVERLHHLIPKSKFREKKTIDHAVYTIGAHLIAIYSSMPYTQFVRQRILLPLDMSTSTFSGAAAARSRRLSEGWTNTGRRVPYWLPETAVEVMAGSHGLISSAIDMTKWITVLLNHGVDPSTNETVLPWDVFAETLKVQVTETLADGVRIDGGMGWISGMDHGHEMTVALGGVSGSRAFVALLPRDRIGLITLINGDMCQHEESVAKAIIEKLLGLEPSTKMPVATPSVAPVSMKMNISRRHLASKANVPLSAKIKTSMLDSDAHRECWSIDPLKSAVWPEVTHVGDVPLEVYAGQYHNPGFGTFTLCAPSSNSSECASVLRDFAAYDQPTRYLPTLYAAWPRVFASHFRIEHFLGR